MASYKYQPLNLDRPSIRLLKLLEGNFGDDIQCELIDGWIEESIPYDALSYTWGSTERAATITVDGSIMGVTVNAYEALQQIRSKDESRYLWIDAICIDQENLQERGHQVQQMGLIYQKAERVFIWLGQGTKETDLVMDSMKSLHDIFIKKEGGWRELARFRMSVCPAGCYEGMELILSRPWFRRIWVLQEIANARVATVLCGRKSISASTFAQVPGLLGLQPDPHCQAVLDIMPGLSRQTSWWKEKRDLYTLLKKFRESEATDERDIVYALLGISSDACKVLLPNYEKPLLQVIRDTTSFLLFHIYLDSSLYIFPNWTLPEFLQSLDSLGNIVLRNASMDGQEIMVKRLLDTGQVELDFKDQEGRTPLSSAARNGHEAVVKLLLATRQVEVNSKDPSGRTPLWWAAWNNHEAVLKLLLDTGQVELNLKDQEGRTLLWWAARSGHEAVVKLLLATGQVEVDSKEISGQTPLSSAAWNGHEAIVKLLLATGQVELNSKDTSGRTPLSWAARSGHEAVVKLLLAISQVEVDSKDRGGRTPLWWATWNRHEAVVKLLLATGQVKVDSKEISGQTPLSLAAENGHKAIVKLLREHTS
ncbi:uncharacterized protein PAC_17561 [Phialocephala subalpina]|uniref:Heterokaryon incompatibility domain-containing protein n=1 Tax=Phialocephala subalpina TaxID=576137 RepID=A0A1L7XRI5_9HELO|nr:uncharacterized protein PAC_17561 [Phialocephala subalpina]